MPKFLQTILRYLRPARDLKRNPLSAKESQLIEAHIERALFSRETPGWGAPKGRNTRAVRRYTTEYYIKHGKLPMGVHPVGESGGCLPNPIFLAEGDFLMVPPEHSRSDLH